MLTGNLSEVALTFDTRAHQMLPLRSLPNCRPASFLIGWSLVTGREDQSVSAPFHHVKLSSG